MTEKEELRMYRKGRERQSEKNWKRVKQKKYEQQAHQCIGCLEKFPKRNMEIDHIVPKSKGGFSNDENLQLLCSACNRIKSAKSQARFLRETAGLRIGKTYEGSFGVAYDDDEDEIQAELREWKIQHEVEKRKREILHQEYEASMKKIRKQTEEEEKQIEKELEKREDEINKHIYTEETIWDKIKPFVYTFVCCIPGSIIAILLILIEESKK